VKQDTSIQSRMLQLIKYCAEIHPTSEWEKFGAINYAQDLTTFAGLLSQSDQKASETARGFWISMREYELEPGIASKSLYVFVSPAFSEGDILDWISDPFGYQLGEVRSNTLSEIYRLAYRGGARDLGHDAEYPLSLCFIALMARWWLEHLSGAFRLSFEGAAAGFDDGDVIQFRPHHPSNGLRLSIIPE